MTGVQTCALPISDRLERGEQLDGTSSHQALIEKTLRDREDRRAIDIVLQLSMGRVADSHRSHVAIARQMRYQGLLDLRAPIDAVAGLQPQRRGRRQILNEAQIPLHGARCAQTIERLHGEISVADPAVAVVPVAGPPELLGDRRGDRKSVV